MDIKRSIKSEIEIMFFGFSTIDLCEDFNLEVINCIHKVLSQVKETLLLDMPHNSENINSYIQDLTNIYCESVKPIFKQFQSEIENIFHIPENIELFTIGVSDEIFTDEDIQQLKGEIKQLTEKLLQEKVMLAKLEQQKSVFDSKVKVMMKTISDLLSVQKQLAFNLASKQECTLFDGVKKVLNEHLQNE